MKELNNPNPGSQGEQPAKGTEGDRLDDEGGKLEGKFKSEKDKAKSYEEVEKAFTKSQQDNATLKERLAKLEGKFEEREKIAKKAPEITPEEHKKMDKQFKDDFTEDSITALYNYNRPFIDQLNRQQEELDKMRNEQTSLTEREQKKELISLAREARSDDPQGFDELKDSIEKELRGNETWARFENPYQAVYYHLKGKSTSKLAKSDDAERKSFVEGSSEVPPEKDKKKQYVNKILKAKVDTRL